MPRKKISKFIENSSVRHKIILKWTKYENFISDSLKVTKVMRNKLQLHFVTWDRIKNKSEFLEKQQRKKKIKISIFEITKLVLEKISFRIYYDRLKNKFEPLEINVKKEKKIIKDKYIWTNKIDFGENFISHVYY